MWRADSRQAPTTRDAAERALGHRSRILILRSVWELLVMPEYDDARPVRGTDELVDLEANQGILPHPFDFLTHRGEP